MDKSFGARDDEQLRKDYIAVYKAVQENMPAKRPENDDLIWARLIVDRLHFIALTEKDMALFYFTDQICTRLYAHLHHQTEFLDGASEREARRQLKSKTKQFLTSLKPKE
jgi:hypothetical protein